MGRTTGARTGLASFALLGLLLAGCGGSPSKSAAPAGSPSNSAPTSAAVSPAAPAGSSPPAFASTSAGSQTDRLSKPDFLIAMNAVCSAVDAQRQALPTPTSVTDYAAITTRLTGTLRILPVFIDHAETLVAKSAERAALERNWLAIKKADYAATKPLAVRTITDSNAHDAAKVDADLRALDAAPDHGASMATYLRDFGLTSCASLESR
jgi:hypothetical protein